MAEPVPSVVLRFRAMNETARLRELRRLLAGVTLSPSIQSYRAELCTRLREAELWPFPYGEPRA